MARLDSLEITLCEMQAKLFVRSGQEGFNSESFIKAFMRGKTAKELDSSFSHMQWAGENYIMSRLKDEEMEDVSLDDNIYDIEALYWMGYIYRYWHYYTGEDSKKIYKQANPKTMSSSFLMYHTMSPEMAIDRLKETYKSRQVL